MLCNLYQSCGTAGGLEPHLWEVYWDVVIGSGWKYEQIIPSHEFHCKRWSYWKYKLKRNFFLKSFLIPHAFIDWQINFNPIRSTRFVLMESCLSRVILFEQGILIGLRNMVDWWNVSQHAQMVAVSQKTKFSNSLRSFKNLLQTAATIV